MTTSRGKKLCLSSAERIKLADYIRAELARDAKAINRPTTEFVKGFAALTGIHHLNPGHIRRTFRDLGLVHGAQRNGQVPSAAPAPAAGRIAAIEKAIDRLYADLYGERFPPA